MDQPPCGKQDGWCGSLTDPGTSYAIFPTPDHAYRGLEPVSAAVEDPPVELPQPDPRRTLVEATALRDRGWRPFPLDHPWLHECASAHVKTPCDGKRGKHPAGGWATMTANSPADGLLERWFREPRNIGIGCAGSELLVVDDDTFAYGTDSFEDWCAKQGYVLPGTYRVRTSRGWHYYFSDPEREFGNTTGGLPEHIDIRGARGGAKDAGGYVVAAGSRHASGDEYLAEDDHADVALVPEWLKQVLRTPRERPSGTSSAPGPGQDGWTEEPRYGRREQLLAQYTRHLKDVRTKGGSFRHELFLAARDGWRCVDLGILEEPQLVRALERAIDRVWGAEPDAHDEGIVFDEARERATASPWVLLDPPQPADAGSEDGASATDDGLADDEALYASDLAARVRSMRLTEEARTLLAAETRPVDPGPALTSLAALLAEPDDGEVWRLEGLWPEGGKVLLSAPQKSGKTTMVGNLVRALADGQRFLARPEVRQGEWKTINSAGFAAVGMGERRIALFDFEMTRRKLRDWLRDQCIANVAGVHVELMRGRVWDIRDAAVRRMWAEQLASLDVGVIIVDPIGPILGSLGIDENDNSAVGAYLFALDALVREAGASELLVVHHAGHGSERARGASAFLGWPDANWAIVRDEETNVRAFRAEGRDVWVPETNLVYDRNTRRLGLGEGDRSSTRSAGHAEIMAAIVTETPGETVNGLKRLARETDIGTKVQHSQDAIAAAEQAGLIHAHQGPNRSRLHYPGACSDACHDRSMPLLEPR